MFSIGERVRVLRSSVEGKAGPRRNSLGYVSNVGKVYLLPCNLGRVMVASVQVIFSRYGNERRVRCERRDFLNVFPIAGEASLTSPDLGTPLTPSDVEKFVKASNPREFRKDFWQRELIPALQPGHHKGKGGIAGIIVPAESSDKLSLLEASQEECKAYIESMLRNRSITLLAGHAGEHIGTIKNVIEHLLWHIYSAHTKKTVKSSLIRWAFLNKENLAALLATLTIISTIHRTSNERAEIGVLRGDKGRAMITSESCVNNCASGMFQPGSLERKETALNPEKTSVRYIISNMCVVRNTLLSLAKKRH